MWVRCYALCCQDPRDPAVRPSAAAWLASHDDLGPQTRCSFLEDPCPPSMGKQSGSALPFCSTHPAKPLPHPLGLMVHTAHLLLGWSRPLRGLLLAFRAPTLTFRFLFCPCIACGMQIIVHCLLADSVHICRKSVVRRFIETRHCARSYPFLSPSEHISTVATSHHGVVHEPRRWKCGTQSAKAKEHTWFFQETPYLW